MSLTILYAGKQHQHCLVLDMRILSAAFFALISLLAVISWQMYAHNARQSLQVKMAQTQNSNSNQTKELESLRDQLDLQLNMLAGKVGTMQAQIGRLNALGEHLVEENNIPADEFNFNELPPMGGPLTEDEKPHIEIDQLYSQLDELDTVLSSRKRQLSLLEILLLNQGVSKNSQIGGLPVVAKGSWVSSPYGIRTDPFTNRATMHRGIDVAGRIGMKINATGQGVVSWAGKRSGYGNMVELIHGDGMVTRYAHASEVLVKEGDVVERGQTVALMGNSGRSTGAHVHYEILKNGRQINPNKYIR